MKKKVYLDTTIPSFLFDERIETKTYTDITKSWWEEERDNYDLYISEETLAELEKGNYPNKKTIIETVSAIQILQRDEKILEIANIYITQYLMPKGLTGDAVHLAYSSFYKVDFLLTWNCNHLANANKKQHIILLNTKLNLFVPEIITPLQLFKEVENVDESNFGGKV